MSYCIQNCAELVCVEVTLYSQKKFIVACLYRAPGTELQLLTEPLQILFNFVKRKSLYLCGDFNVDLLKQESHENTSQFIENIFSSGLHPLITRPTRITTYSSTLIDNIFTNELNLQVDSGLIINDVSDHLPIFQICKYKNLNGTKQNNISTIYKRHVTDESLAKLSSALQHTNWSFLFSIENVNNAYEE